MKMMVFAKSGFAVAGITLLAAVAVLGMVKNYKKSNRSAQPPRVSIPDFPAIEDLIKERDTGDKAGMNAHAWNLFQGLVGNGKAPSWQDWCAISSDPNGTQVNMICPPLDPNGKLLAIAHASPEDDMRNRQRRMVARMKLSLSIPRQILATERGRLFADTSQQELETAEVLFDPKSAWQIIQCFSDNPQNPSAVQGSDLQRYSLNPQYLASIPTVCRGGSPAYNSFASLQNDSISIKTVWVVTAAEAGNISAEIPAWDWEFQEAQITPDHPWQAKVSVVLDSSKPCTDSSQWGNPGVQDNVRLNFAVQVPSNCFYSLPLSWQDFSSVVGIKRDILRRQFGWSQLPHLILLGFHVTTKEIPNWTWQTFWWSGRPGGDGNQNYPFSTESPALQVAVGSQWSHFVMTTTFGKPPSDNTHMPAIVYNPYLEGLLTNGDGTKSNCASCHQDAAFATAAPLDHAALGYQLGIVRSSDSPLSCSSADPNPASYFEGAEKMDCLWSLSESNAFPSSEHIKTDLNQTVLNLLGKINTDLKHKFMKVLKK